MANSFQLRIVTPKAQLLDEEVREVVGPGTQGEFGVLPNHITFLSSIEPGVVQFRSSGGSRKVAVRGGFVEVLGNVMTVLADDAAFGEGIDAGQVRGELQQAEQRLEKLSPADDDHAGVDLARRWALARLEAAR